MLCCRRKGQDEVDSYSSHTTTNKTKTKTRETCFNEGNLFSMNMTSTNLLRASELRSMQRKTGTSKWAIDDLLEDSQLWIVLVC